MSKFYKEKVENKVVVDETTGEISELYINKKCELDEFLLMFLSNIQDVTKLQGNEIRTLLYVVKYSKLEKDFSMLGNVFTNNSVFKQLCRMNGFNVSDSNLNKYIQSLASKGFLIKQKRGVYILNPKYFFKGSVNDRMKAVIKIQYFDGFKVTTYDPIK